ncbi:MAG: DUF4231 domain-containing protein [Leptolyngbyaceae cyanobacterium MO_188.B28]|nr:DUF4231 domain-containing protein [Leptolyngbyaceae cyanobacterium MO_188.B28]
MPPTDKPSPSPTVKEPTNLKLLASAWQRQQAYSKNASRYQKRFFFLRIFLSILSVAVVILSVLENPKGQSPWDTVINTALLILPITITALLAYSVRFDRGQNWILLRGSAESLKMEIYYYRTHVNPYHEKRDDRLAKRIKQISGGMKGSSVHQSALAPYEEEIKKGILPKFPEEQSSGDLSNSTPQQETDNKIYHKYYSDLTPEEYLALRLETQFDWYRKKSKGLAKRLQIVQASVYFFGGLGTYLAATSDYKSWVAVTAALTAALTNYLEFKQLEASLVGYNQAADALYDIRAWWYSLPVAEREKSESDNFTKLVKGCEETIRSENSTWLQDMQDRLSQLYETPEKESEANVSPTPNLRQEDSVEENRIQESEFSKQTDSGS